jgi:hypothetical protein
MNTRKRRKRAITFEVAPDLYDQLKAFLADRGTAQTDELTEALRRHLAYPTPPPAPPSLPAPYVEPKRPRGRPRKEAGNGTAQ